MKNQMHLSPPISMRKKMARFTLLANLSLILGGDEGGGGGGLISFFSIPSKIAATTRLRAHVM